MTVPATHPDDPLLLACRAIGRAMDLFDEAACRVLGVGRSDLRALNLLEHGPLTAAVIADRLTLTRPAVTALVDRLERAGYVARTPDSRDRRVTQIVLRPATWQAFAGVYRPLGQRVAATTADLTTAERNRVIAALERMTGAFDEARHRLAHDADDGRAAP